MIPIDPRVSQLHLEHFDTPRPDVAAILRPQDLPVGKQIQLGGWIFWGDFGGTKNEGGDDFFMYPP